MFRPAARAALRSSHSSLAPARTSIGQRFVSTAPPHLKSRSWKSSALRWGIAVAGIYYYNTSSVFADHPQNNLLNPNVDALDDESGSSTLDALTASSRKKSQANPSVLQSSIEEASKRAVSDEPATATSPQGNSSVAAPAIGAAELEEEAEGEGAFNPITGEINWDCPCLGGMAYGPCGPEFREAFSCFVYSQEEPKGMDCIEKFQKMQTCFRAHPEVYSDELEGDDELDENLAHEKAELEKEVEQRRAAVDAKMGGSAQGPSSSESNYAFAPTSANEKRTSKSESTNKKPITSYPGSAGDAREDAAHVQSNGSPIEEARARIDGYTDEHKHGASSSPVRKPKTSAVADAISESEELVPKAAFDATGSSSKATEK